MERTSANKSTTWSLTSSASRRTGRTYKRIVRGGLNTLCPFEENPRPDRMIEKLRKTNRRYPGDLVVDIIPVVEAWEAEFGRTFVLGSDAGKLKLRAALEPMWHKVKG
ncbi:hypothetical protein E4U52_004797 [Claviceps spartinae]|nr:hypothetical protein E4U52_004797 [Claviceps spartinae]